MASFDLGKVVGDKGDKGDKGDTGATGATGNGIASIELYNTSGKTKTYRITYTNGSTFDFNVVDGDDGTATIVTEWESTTSDSKVPSEKLVKTSMDGKVDKESGKSLFSGSYEDLTNKPTIPSAYVHPSTKQCSVSIPSDVADLSDNSNTPFTPKSHAHGNLQDDGSVGTTNNVSKNVVTDSNGKITTEAKPTVPTDVSDLTDTGGVIPSDVSDLSDSNNTAFTPKSHKHGDITNDGKLGTASRFVVTDSNKKITVQEKLGNITLDGKVGTDSGKPLITTTNGVVTTGAFGTSSGQFAEGNHTHSAYVNPAIADNLTTNDSTQVLSAKQGKVLADLIGNAITYINQ